ncbi:ribosomal-protein-alanine N-acetyltransferase [Leifsonia xyli subsp. cynodontis DSM 46306]|jgi:RimJ/RimL family protein N-acetyltransferase|uniref:N-acetyltransferase domain-containing protein n=1 Tax=Leifsonia xyli subsp. cynodontis DSM 46306 TaxID=1389489 RepID=U3P4B9_LEIXC|nr:GNAT family protein [Leifsonia xyli]AGW40606.1 ribosomal-protein-alanine N-acetyltransferase [Leifsonia xyli subsp. cynodontis DSM 46306]
MVAIRPDPAVPLEGRTVRLCRLGRDDLPALFAAIGRPEVFAGGWGGGPAAYRDTYEEWRAFILGYLPWETAAVTAVRLSESGRLVGTTALGDIDLANGSAHIGWTAYAPEVWGTRVNAETKRLLLGTAFEHGFERVKLQADVANERSRATILRLGATFEGVLRHTQQRADGSWRDTAVYSILREEWPAVRKRLDARLGVSAPPSALR